GGRRMVHARFRKLAIGTFLTLASIGALSAQSGQPQPAAAAGIDSLSHVADLTTIAIMRRQAALRPAVDIRQQAVLANDVGYAGIAFEGDGITLYWKGAIPSELKQAVSATSHLAPIKFEAARFSESELAEYANKIWEVAQPDRSEHAKLTSDIA